MCLASHGADGWVEKCRHAVMIGVMVRGIPRGHAKRSARWTRLGSSLSARNRGALHVGGAAQQGSMGTAAGSGKAGTCGRYCAHIRARTRAQPLISCFGHRRSLDSSAEPPLVCKCEPDMVGVETRVLH